MYTKNGAIGFSFGAAPVLIDTMINRARAFIYSTAPSPLNAVCVKHALAIINDEPALRARHAQLVRYANQELQSVCGLNANGTQILPVIVGPDKAAIALAERVQRDGFDVRPVRPPTVPEGTSRLRISVTLNVSQEQVAGLMASLADGLF